MGRPPLHSALRGLIVASITVAVTSLGPPEGSAGTLDFRYPDYIVKPLVDCPYEGVFPHPHDCTWYYRCYDRYGYGKFWRAYFKCEPGTYFSDDLDQCVFQGSVTKCNVAPPPPSPPPQPTCEENLGICITQDICPPSRNGTSFVKRAEICYGSSKVCEGPGGPVTPYCSADSYYDNTNKRCLEAGRAKCQVQDSRPAAKEVVCEDHLIECREISCHESNPHWVANACQVVRNCYHQNGYYNQTNICGVDGWFDPISNHCYDPKALVCSPPYYDFVFLTCSMVGLTCSIWESCEMGYSVLFCPSVFSCTYNLRSSPARSCPPTTVYDHQQETCVHMKNSVQRIDGASRSCLWTGIIPPANQRPPPQTYLTPLSYSCRYFGEILDYSYAQPELNCYTRPYCDSNGIQQGTLIGCDYYYECRYNFYSFFLQVYRVYCGLGSFYSYQHGRCGSLRDFIGYECPPPPTPTPRPPTTLPTSTTTTTTTTTTSPPTPSTAPTESSSSSTVNLDIVISCASDGQVPPLPPNAKKLFCTTNSLCNLDGGYEGSQTLCTTYYKCNRDQGTGFITPTQMACSANTLYSYKEKSCVIPKNNLCLQDN